MSISRQQWLLCNLVALICFGFAIPAYASSVQITVDTSSLAGTNATMAFDLVDGGPPANSVTLSGFSTDGALGTASTTGSVSGNLPSDVMLDDSSFFSEYLQNITLGNTLSFVITDTGNTADASSLPDGFSFFLLDQNTFLPLATTTDPTGGDALFLLNIGEPSPLEIYSSDLVSTTSAAVSPGPTNSVPEPPSAWLVLIGMITIATVIVWQHHGSKNSQGDEPTAV